uniref:peptidase U32 family protein n=1 Tax=Dysosmobacter sp. TaxID=2591382 RepID=UPI003AB5B6D0
MRPELLSPAGSPEALRAAVQNGADAVYLGWGTFNARQGAKNFSDAEFSDALLYCHERGVRVFLTLNTLVTDRELPRALDTAAAAARLGVDAVLVQDWGLFLLLRQMLPDLPVHASTQMSAFTAGAAKLLAADGCERVVLARECSAADTAAICAACPAEIEIFAHGALCMCYSGQCEMSALIGGRSGNRGRCAQPCRLPYAAVGGKKGNPYPLSLKDNCMAASLEEAAEMGVSCLKLEGRMKRPEYVAVVTRIYDRLLSEGRGPTAAEAAELEAAFSRSGFTDGYWQGHTGKDMFGTRPAGAADPRELFEAAKAAYEKGDMRTVGVDLSCTVAAGVPCTLTAADRDGHAVTVTGPVPEAARTRALTGADLEARLRKTGGTAYRC